MIGIVEIFVGALIDMHACNKLSIEFIKTKHNSNQTTLEMEIIQEYSYYVLGFVPSSILNLKGKNWSDVVRYLLSLSSENFPALPLASIVFPDI